MEPVTFTTKQTYKDYLNYNLYRYFQSWFVWFVNIACTYLILLAIFSDRSSVSNPALMIFASGAVLIVMPLRFYFRVRKAYKSRLYAGIEVHWKIGEFGIAYEQGSAKGEIGWDRIEKFTESKHWIMLWSDKIIIFYFHKKNLASGQLEQLKKIAHRVGKGFFK